VTWQLIIVITLSEDAYEATASFVKKNNL